MIGGNVVAVPLNRSVVPTFLNIFQPAEQEAYKGSVQAYLDGKIRLPVEESTEEMLLF